MLAFLTCKHSDHKDLCDYTERQHTRFDHVTRFLGGPIVIWHKLKKDYKNKSLIVEELEEICKPHHTRLEAYMLIANSNQKIFGEVMKNLQFSYQYQNNNYPTIVAPVRDLLMGQLKAEYPMGKYIGHENNSSNRSTMGQNGQKNGSNSDHSGGASNQGGGQANSNKGAN